MNLYDGILRGLQLGQQSAEADQRMKFAETLQQLKLDEADRSQKRFELDVQKFEDQRAANERALTEYSANAGVRDINRQNTLASGEQQLLETQAKQKFTQLLNTYRTDDTGARRSDFETAALAYQEARTSDNPMLQTAAYNALQTAGVQQATVLADTNPLQAFNVLKSLGTFKPEATATVSGDKFVIKRADGSVVQTPLRDAGVVLKDFAQNTTANRDAARRAAAEAAAKAADLTNKENVARINADGRTGAARINAASRTNVANINAADEARQMNQQIFATLAQLPQDNPQTAALTQYYGKLVGGTAPTTPRAGSGGAASADGVTPDMTPEEIVALAAGQGAADTTAAPAQAAGAAAGGSGAGATTDDVAPTPEAAPAPAAAAPRLAPPGATPEQLFNAAQEALAGSPSTDQVDTLVQQILQHDVRSGQLLLDNETMQALVAKRGPSLATVAKANIVKGLKTVGDIVTRGLPEESIDAHRRAMNAGTMSKSRALNLIPLASPEFRAELKAYAGKK